MLSAGELWRKIVHVGVGGLALLLRDLPWWAAIGLAVSALLFNWLVLPRIGGRGLWRGAEHRAGYPLGILLYPLSVLGLVLAFPGESRWMAAAVWGMLAGGDGMAALAGQALPGPRLPWNERKSWVGLCAFVLFGALAASLLAAWTLHLPLTSAFSGRMLGLTLPLALLCALAESAPTTLDDNLTVPLVGALLLPLLAQIQPQALLGDPDAGRRLLLGLAGNSTLALVARRARLLDGPGAFSAAAIGTLITLGLDFAGLAMMVTFFVLANAATKLGYPIKAARGLAEERGGVRGWRNAWANGGVPALLALSAGLAPADARGLLALGYAAAVASAAADTCSSEIGKAYGRRTILITSVRPVAPGTEGGVSLEGTLAGLAGALLVASTGALLGLYPARAALLVTLAALFASLAESVVGSVAGHKGWMGNHLLNAFNTAVGAGLVVLLARLAPGCAP